MKGDFTRQTFRRANHYRSVLAQQGRVNLDADWNEQALIQAHLDQVTATDTIGCHGAPGHGAGMAITLPDGGPPRNADGADLQISAGRYYVDGILCENEHMVPLAGQPDLPGVSLPGVLPEAEQGRYIAFLDVWLEHLSPVEQPRLLEVALGGATTTTRARTVWQVRLRRESQPLPPYGDGQLSAQAVTPQDGGPAGCAAPPTAGFRRLENQLYRVEIRDPSPADAPARPDQAGRAGDSGEAAKAGPTFVWSRENGSVAARLLHIDGNVLTVDSPGRDDRLSLAGKPHAWVQVTDLARTRRGEAGYLGRVDHLADTALTIAAWSGPAPVQGDLGEGATVRRWESGPLPVEPGQWIALEDGVQVRFEAGGTFRTGDYWLIPARTANLDGAPVIPDLAGDVDWPRQDGSPVPQHPEGIIHSYADIATLVLSPEGWTLESDDRHLYLTLTELARLVDVEYAGGDGQRTIPGQRVPRPLEVSVSRGLKPVAGATIRFEADDADGRLAANAATLDASVSSTLDAVTGSDGVARCYWRPADDPGRPSQKVSARWVGAGQAAADPPIDFFAGFDLASATAFDPGGCGTLAGAVTVQDAVQRLAAGPAVTIAGGDGQNGVRGSDLPRPLQVRVRSGCGENVADVTVRFTAADGVVAADPAGLAGGQPSVDVRTGQDGMAGCYWRLGDTSPVQTATAEIVPGGAPAPPAAPVTFVAGSPFASGLHVTEIVLTQPGTPLALDALVGPAELAGGVAILLDGDPAAATVDGKPVLTVTLDLPFPFSQQDRALWGEPVVGTTPLTLTADVALTDWRGSPAITWTPVPAASALVNSVLTMMGELGRGDKVLAHLRLSGRTIAAADGRDRVVNGLAAVAVGPDGTPEMRLPSVDDVRGADIELRFWLVPVVTHLVLLPSRAGRLSLKSATDAIALAVPRDDLRATLPAGVLVTDGPGQNAAAAARAVGRAFRSGAARQLTIVVAERFTATADVIREALAATGVTLEVVAAADPATAVTARLEAGQPVDGVLTDHASAAPVIALAGFTTEVPL
jgi:Family of unknown function (DUF6519)